MSPNKKSTWSKVVDFGNSNYLDVAYFNGRTVVYFISSIAKLELTSLRSTLSFSLL